MAQRRPLPVALERGRLAIDLPPEPARRVLHGHLRRNERASTMSNRTRVHVYVLPIATTIGLPARGLAAAETAPSPTWPAAVREIQYSSAANQTLQPALFNTLAAPRDRLSPEQIRHFVDQARVPPTLAGVWADAAYGHKPVLFRRQSGAVRITVFDGGHAIIHRAALAWLAAQGRR
jgi:hypothetical protein